MHREPADDLLVDGDRVLLAPGELERVRKIVRCSQRRRIHLARRRPGKFERTAQRSLRFRIAAEIAQHPAAYRFDASFVLALHRRSGTARGHRAIECAHRFGIATEFGVGRRQPPVDAHARDRVADAGKAGTGALQQSGAGIETAETHVAERHRLVELGLHPWLVGETVRDLCRAAIQQFVGTGHRAACLRGIGRLEQADHEALHAFRGRGTL